MKRRSWKRVESKVARELGGQRTPLSGSHSKYTSGDVIFPEGDNRYVEVKSRKAMVVFSWWEEVVEKAKKEKKKQPILILHKTGSRLYLKVDRLEIKGDK